MPTYDYQCNECSHAFEVFHGMSEKPNIFCPQCEVGKVSLKISRGAGIHFKGSGFYVNDYKKNEDPPTKSTASKDSPATDTKSSTNTAGGDKSVASTSKKTEATTTSS